MLIGMFKPNPRLGTKKTKQKNATAQICHPGRFYWINIMSLLWPLHQECAFLDVYLLQKIDCQMEWMNFRFIKQKRINTHADIHIEQGLSSSWALK